MTDDRGLGPTTGVSRELLPVLYDVEKGFCTERRTVGCRRPTVPDRLDNIQGSKRDRQTGVPRLDCSPG